MQSIPMAAIVPSGCVRSLQKLTLIPKPKQLYNGSNKQVGGIIPYALYCSYYQKDKSGLQYELMTLKDTIPPQSFICKPKLAEESSGKFRLSSDERKRIIKLALAFEADRKKEQMGNRKRERNEGKRKQRSKKRRKMSDRNSESDEEELNSDSQSEAESEDSSSEEEEEEQEVAKVEWLGDPIREVKVRVAYLLAHSHIFTR